MANTPNYNLYKPNRADNLPVDTTLSDNFVIIDNEIKNRKTETDALEVRVDNIIAQSGTSSTEVVDARGPFTVLSNRLDNVDVSIGTKADKTYVDQQFNNFSGAPKGVYATLAALQSAFPTGTTGVYLVTADGKWYYWNTSAWTAGGTYQSTGLSDGSVTLPKLSSDAVNYLKKTAVDNVLLNTNFPDLTNWITLNATGVTNSSSEVNFTPTAQFGQIKQNTGIPGVVGEKYYIAAQVKTTKSTVILNLSEEVSGNIWGSKNHTGSGNYELISFIVSPTNTSNITFKIHETATSGFAQVTVKQPVLINLTKMFGAGNEPDKYEFEALLTKYLSGVYVNDIAYLPLFLGDVFRLNSPLDKKADKLVLPNKVVNGNFTENSNWGYLLATGSILANEIRFTASAQYGQAFQDLGNSVNGTKYYVSANIKSTSNLAKLHLYRNDTGATFGEALHSGSGNYERLSFIATANVVAQMRVRAVDYRTSAWDEIRAKEYVVIDLTAIFGAGNEPSLSDFESMINRYNNGSIFFNTKLLTNVIMSEIYKPINTPTVDTSMLPIFVDRAGDIIKVNSKYNATQDLRIKLQKKGPNAIFDFYQFHLISNTTNVTSKDLVNGTLLLDNQTDFFGPHIVKATTSINGDSPASSDFTGGNHGFNGDFTGTATGRTISVDLFVDGRKVSDFTGYCNYIDIYWVNNIQATNTKKSAGTGREVLQEYFHLHFDGTKWTVKNRIEFLEAVSWEKYYGIQISNPAWNDSVFYHSSANRKWNALNINTDSTDKRCNKMTLRKNNDYVDVSLSESIGIGNKEFQNGFNYGAFSTTAAKSYFFMVNGANSFSAGDTVSYEGYYRFYSK